MSIRIAWPYTPACSSHINTKPNPNHRRFTAHLAHNGLAILALTLALALGVTRLYAIMVVHAPLTTQLRGH